MKIFQILKNKDKILGQNARNSIFIKKAGSKKGRMIADDKLLTKKLLIENKIPSPELLGIIENYKELKKFNWDLLPKSFVMKPVKGSQGGGIEIFYNRDKLGNWIRADGSKISLDELKSLAQDILDGKYSLDKNTDKVFFEKRIRPHKDFKNFTYKGTPDVRIVIFNNIPIQAYVRFPTKESEGKANMILGAVGTGIDLASGITTTSVKGKDRGGRGTIIEFVPGTKLPYQGLRIPYWEEILKYAIEAQKAIGLSFVACDFLIDADNGPVIVEMNARPGLSIQLVNRAGLAWQLNKVKGIKVKNTAQGIRLGKELFGGEIEETIERVSGKQVISNVMPVEIGFEDQKIKTLAMIDTSIRTTIIDSKTAIELGIIDEATEEGEFYIEKIIITLANQTFEAICKIVSKNISGYKIHIGRKDLGNFIIDIRKIEKEEESELREKILSQKPKSTFRKLDKTLEEISRKLSIVRAIKPINLTEEKEKFFNSNFEYNPIFEYEPLKFDTDDLLRQLNQLNPPSTELGELYKEKIREFRKMIFLMESIGQGPTTYTQRSQSIYGKPSKRILTYAEQLVNNTPEPISKSKKTLTIDEVKKFIETKLKELNIQTKVIITQKGPPKASVGKITGKIKINPNYDWTENRLKGTFYHEIAVHLVRSINGEKQQYGIFKLGTSDYLKTEEGLATLNKYIHKENKIMWMGALRTLALDYALTHDFQLVFQFINSKLNNPDSSWEITYHIKRGIEDTSQPGAFTKGQYFEWAITTAEKLKKNKKALAYIFNGKSDIDTLEKFTKPSGLYKEMISEKDLEEFLRTNKRIRSLN